MRGTPSGSAGPSWGGGLGRAIPLLSGWFVGQELIWVLPVRLVCKQLLWERLLSGERLFVRFLSS